MMYRCIFDYNKFIDETRKIQQRRLLRLVAFGYLLAGSSSTFERDIGGIIPKSSENMLVDP